MSAHEQVAAAEKAERDARAGVARAEMRYANEGNTSQTRRAVTEAQNALHFAVLDVKQAREKLEREAAAAKQAEQKATLDQLAQQRDAVARAWPMILALISEISKHATAIFGLATEIEGHITKAQAAAGRAKYLAAEAGVQPDTGRVPTKQFAQMLVRAVLANLPPNAVAAWCASGMPFWQDPMRTVFDQALAAVRAAKPFVPQGADDAPLGWNQSLEYQRSHDEAEEHGAAGGST